MTTFKVVFLEKEPVEVEGVKVFSDNENFFVQLDGKDCAVFDKDEVKCIMPVSTK